MGHILLISILLQVLSQALCENNVTKRLPNEECRLRETLVHVDKQGSKYYPLIVKLHRCRGACRHYPPSVKKCVSGTPSKYVAVKVTSLRNFKGDTVYLRNDSSCSCQCVHDEKACSPKTQTFDPRSCTCQCKPEYRLVAWKCQPPFHWDPVTCSCGCNLRCGYLEQLDKKQCQCTCKMDAYMKCAQMNKYLNPSTCECMLTADKEKATGQQSCEGLPRKWIVILVVSGIVVLLVLVFDCTLYHKKTGSLYKVTHCCKKKYKKKTEERSVCLPMRTPDEG